MNALDTAHLSFEQGIWHAAGVRPGYWGELEKDEFNLLCSAIANSDDFDLAVLEFFRERERQDLYPYITDTFGRGSWHALLHPQNSNHLAIDLGAGLGAITEFLSGRYEEVYSIEACRERAEFLRIRKEKKELSNVTVINDNIYRLPFHDGTADLIVCNGVLEWVGLGKQGPVVQIQREFLREVMRVLKDDGILYIGIENRFALAYFLGARDHSGKRFTSLAPRRLANLMMGGEGGPAGFSVESLLNAYRTYTYSHGGYKQLLSEAGFAFSRFFCTEPSYDIPSVSFPAEASAVMLQSFFSVYTPSVLPTWLRKALCSNYFIFVGKQNLDARLIDRPIYFGYYDRCYLSNGHIERVSKNGGCSNEPLVNGRKLLELKPVVKRRVTSSEIRRCHEQYLSQAAPFSTYDDIDSFNRQFDSVMTRYLTRELREETKQQILRHHRKTVYHGDFWLGNIMYLHNREGLSAIDSEQQLFGSPELDIADFVIDYQINGRENEQFQLDLKELYQYYGIENNLKELIRIALVRQILRYSPLHRSHQLVYRYIKLLQELQQGSGLLLK